MDPLFVGIGGSILLVVLIVWLIASRYKVARPNEAYIITGQKGRAIANPETGLVSTDLSVLHVIHPLKVSNPQWTRCS